jgi:flagellar basal body-associated protein FliL
MIWRQQGKKIKKKKKMVMAMVTVMVLVMIGVIAMAVRMVISRDGNHSHGDVMVVRNRLAYWIIPDTIDVIVRIRDIENAVASLEQI